MTVTFPLNFEKMSGTGNDFIVIDHREHLIPLDQQPGFAKKVCRRMFSVGADGLILIENSDIADFKWRFYNSDGSMAEMCGNGARCAARFAYHHRIAGKRTMTFETEAGIIEAEVAEDEEYVRVLMTPPFDYRSGMQVGLDGIERDVDFVNTGVPHAVIFVEEGKVPVKIWGRKVRFHELFSPAGTNVNFVRIRGESEIEVRTYERGVENETMACGTGAVASAIYAAVKHGCSSPIDVVTSGGEILTILFDQIEGGAVKNVYMQGPARRIYSGELTAESLL